MMLLLRWGRLWLLAGWALVVLAVMGSLLPAHDMKAVHVNDKLEHLGTYAVLMLWFAGIYPRSRYPAVALGLLGLGLSMEWAQGVMNLGRQRDMNDMIANAAGVILGTGLALLFLGGWAQKLESRVWPAPR